MKEEWEEGGRGRESGRRKRERKAQGGEESCWNFGCPREKKEEKKKKNTEGKDE